MAFRDRGGRGTGSALVAILGIALATAGCVTKETYTAQVNRTTNLQRLLAEEEKRSSDLATEIARLKKQVGDLEAQNKVMTSQLTDARSQIVRSLEEVGRLQEEVQQARKASSSTSKGKGVPPTATEPPDRLDELEAEVTGKKKAKAIAPEDTGQAAGKKKAKAAAPEAEGEPQFLYHEVKRGETLFSIAKRYKTNVKTLQEFNDLAGNEIRVGDLLIVGEKK